LRPLSDLEILSIVVVGLLLISALLWSDL